MADLARGGPIWRQRGWWPILLLSAACSSFTTHSPSPPPPPPAAVDPPPPAPPVADVATSSSTNVAAGMVLGAAVAVMPSARSKARVSRAVPTHPMARAAADATLCDLTGTRLPAAACAELREQNGLTRAGIDAAPTSLRMKLRETITYAYSIGKPGDEAIVRDNVASGTTAIVGGQVALGHYNYAKLSGDGGIAIKPLDSEVQDTRENPTPTWRWELTANAAGEHRLKLEAGVELRADGTAPVRLGQNAKRIDVAVAVAGIDKVKQIAETTDTMLGISTSLLKKLGLLFGAAGSALVAYRALRSRPKAAADA